MAINPKKLLPPSKTGEIVKSVGTNISKVSVNITPVQSSSIVPPTPLKNPEETVVENINVIRIKVIKIEDLLKGTIAAEKKALDDKKREESTKRREKEEEKLEKPTKKEKGTLKVPSIPKMGFFDRIKNFISNVILGYFAVRLLDHLPKIIPVLKFLGKATDFVIDNGGKLLNGLVTFIDWGYKAYDATKGFLKNLGGDNFTKVFDAFNGAVGTLIETAIIAATVLATQGEGGVLDVGMDMARDRLLGKGAQTAGRQVATQAAGQVGRTAGVGAGAAAGIVAGAGLLASALGEGAFQVRKVAIKPIQNLENAYNKDKNPITKIGRGIALTMVRPFYGLFSTVGFLLDVVGAPFRYAIELLRYPFLSEEDKKKQANNLAKFDARIREDLRKALNMLTLGLAFKEKGSFGNIYGNKGSQKQMMGKMAGGGITRGGETLGTVKREIGGTKKRQKYKRMVPKKPGEVEIKPGADIGGEEKILGIFPNPLKGAQRALDTVNPFKVVKTAGEDLGKTDYFGPILAISSKITLGQKPSQQDYDNVGLGINMLISKGIQEKQLKGGIVAAFAEGGLVDPDVLAAAETGGDISNWVAKTFKGEIESNAQKTLRMIRENAQKKKLQQEGKLTQEQAPSPDDMGYGAGVQVSSDSEDFWLLATAAMFENSNPQGAADVAQVIYNRTQYSAWNAPTIRKAILNPGQFQPVRQYGGTNAWASIKTKQDALRFSKSHGKTQEQLERVAAALLDKSKQNDARAFVGPRDSFRAEAYERKNNHLANETEKSRHGHTFGFEPGGAMIGQFKAGKLSAAQVNAQISGSVSQTGLPSLPPTGTMRGQNYGDSRPGGRRHAGQDYDISGNQQFYSRIGGEVVNIGYDPGGYGNYVDIYNKQLNITERIAEGAKVLVSRGSFVRKGQAIVQGESNTGVIHYEIRKGRNTTFGFDGTVDPKKFLVSSSAFHGKSFGIVPKGGMRLNLHEGEVYKVIDKDSVKTLGFDIVKDIIDIENQSQLVAKAPSIISKLQAISGYTNYEQPYGESEIVYVPVEVPVPTNIQSNQSGGSSLVAFGGGEDPFESLYALG